MQAYRFSYLFNQRIVNLFCFTVIISVIIIREKGTKQAFKVTKNTEGPLPLSVMDNTTTQTAPYTVC